jgi:hypothetical protein
MTAYWIPSGKHGVYETLAYLHCSFWSIPIVALLKRIKSKTILMGFGLIVMRFTRKRTFWDINYLKGIETIPLFYKYFVELSK